MGCYGAHLGALGAVTVAAAAEDTDETLWVKASGSFEDIGKRLGCVCIVHYDREWLAELNTLEAAIHVAH